MSPKNLTVNIILCYKGISYGASVAETFYQGEIWQQSWILSALMMSKQLLTNLIAFSTHKAYIYGQIKFICEN